MPEAVLVMGYPASGKSTVAASYVNRGFVHLNRDTEGGQVKSLVPKMIAALSSGKNVVLDNTYASIDDRAPFIAAAKQSGFPIRCVFLRTTIEDAQFNACFRMVQRQGKLLSPAEIKAVKDPNIFPPAVLFAYRKRLQIPTAAEGFESIEVLPFLRERIKGFTNKALILDYDDTLRRTKGGNKWPTQVDDIEILPNRITRLLEYVQQGYLLLGVSNQSGIAKFNPTEAKAIECFNRTNQLLGLDIEYAFCPHNPAPITCFCRKPMPGLGVQFIVKHQLDPLQCIMVGDQTSDQTFALRCGFRYMHADTFFK